MLSYSQTFSTLHLTIAMHKSVSAISAAAQLLILTTIGNTVLAYPNPQDIAVKSTTTLSMPCFTTVTAKVSDHISFETL